MRTPESEDYRRSHRGPGSSAEGYDESLLGPGRLQSRVWPREQELLDRFLRERNVPTQAYLDFACGTGRVLTYLEDRFAHSVGLDVSPEMLEVARRRVRHATLVCGDGTRDARVVDGTFDCITAFRFFLNAQPALRDEAMAFLAGKLRDSASVLIFNIHGNAFSTGFFAAVIRKFRCLPSNQMTFWQVRRMVERHGLRIVMWDGIGYLDEAFYSRMPHRMWSVIESALRPLTWLKPLAVYQYFVCQKATDK